MNGATYEVLVSPKVLVAGRSLLLHSLKTQLDLVQLVESPQWLSGKIYPRVVPKDTQFYPRVIPITKGPPMGIFSDNRTELSTVC